MANSYIEYTANGSTTTFSIPFAYTQQADVAVFVGGTSTSFTFSSSSTISLSTAPTSGVIVRIARTTAITTRAVDFSNGAILTESDLDNSNIQVFQAAQEAIDTAEASILKAADGKFDAQSRVIKNVANPVNAQDAATKNWSETASTSQVNIATTKASEASSSATASANSATAASSSASGAGNSATAAANSATAGAASASTSATKAALATTNGAAQVALATTQAGLATTNGAAQVALATTQAGLATTNGAAQVVLATAQKTIAVTKASESAASATASANSATASANSATASGNSATAAASSASTATTKRNESSASATAAANSAAAAATALDSFDDRYLGAKSSAPGQDNDGNALVQGALYFDTSANGMKVYDGSAWIAASSSGTASLLTYKYIATNNQTTFTGSDANSVTLTYTATNILVLLNGITLDASDYTATNGSSIVLGAGATTGSELVVVAFKSFTVADHHTKTAADARFLGKAGGTMTGDTLHGDNIKAKFGASDDLQVYHDGSNSYISDFGTGDLNLVSTAAQIALITNNKYSFVGQANGTSYVYHDGVAKLSTTATGVDVTGGVNLPDNGTLALGDSTDFTAHHDGTYTRIKNNTGTMLVYQAATSEPIDVRAADSAGAIKRVMLLGGTTPTTAFYHNGTLAGSIQSGGIAFGSDTAAANTLDDYEEGSWTPTLPNGGSLSINKAIYTKIGNLVTAYLYIHASATQNGAQFRIGGLPFTSTSTNYYAGGSLGYCGNLNTSTWCQPLVINNGTYIYFHRNNGGAHVYNNNVPTSTPLIIQMTYTTDS